MYRSICHSLQIYVICSTLLDYHKHVHNSIKFCLESYRNKGSIYLYVAPDAEAHKAFIVGKTPKRKIWFSDEKGVGAAGYGLCLSAEEMSKIGLLCLKKGVFYNKRIVSEKWLEESTKVRLCCGEKFCDMKYGYLWWIIDEKEGSYAAIGNSGNVIYINSKKELVVAVSGYFKPTVFDRIDFIKEQIEEKIAGNSLCSNLQE